MHTGSIRRIGVDAAGRLLATASFDKTVRLWSLPEGQLLRVLRVPVSAGTEGKLNAVAVSPNGSLVATGGWTGYDWDRKISIYLFDVASGRLLRRLTGLPMRIFHLAFSPDGLFLAATLGGKNGVRVWNTGDWRQVLADTEYGGQSYGADFDGGGRLVTTSIDGFVRLYSQDFRRLAEVRAPGGKMLLGTAFSPDGRRVAVGYHDTTRVDVLSGNDLGFLFSPDTASVDYGNLGNVAWSADGRYLYAGGTGDIGETVHIRRWADGGRGAPRDLAAARTTVFDIRPLPGGGVVYGDGAPAFGIFDASGRKILERNPLIADFRDNDTGFLVSNDGTRVQFGFQQWGKRPARFSLIERELVLDPADDGTLVAPVTSAPGLAVSGWKHTFEPELNGRPLQLEQHETSRSLAIAPGGESFLLGTERGLRLFGRDGTKHWGWAAPGVAWGVNVAGNGKVAVAALADGTIRWYRMSDGGEILALFPHNDGKRWITWTPEGFFDHSPGGEDLIGFHLNRGKDQAAEFVGVSQLYDQFYRPDLVAAALTPGSEKVRLAELARIGDVREVLDAGLPPSVAFVTPDDEATLKQRDASVRLRLTDRGGGFGRLVLRLNGITVGGGERGVAVVGTETACPTSVTGRGVTVKARTGATCVTGRLLTLGSGRNVITASAFNAAGKVESRPVSVDVTVKDALSQRPALRVLAVGIETYRDHSLRLSYPVADAKAFTARMQTAAKGIYESVDVTLLSDREATLAGIEAAFDQVAGRTQAHDVFVLYMAGHGLALDGSYHFLPWDLVYRNSDSVRTEALTQRRLEDLLSRVPALKSLILLDTCNAGAFTQMAARGLAEKTALDKLMRATGRAMIVASSESQMALEGYEGHGVFTYALLAALQGAADERGDGDGMVAVNELAQYLQWEVPRITREQWGYEQYPMQNLQGMSFPVGMVR